MRSLKTIALCLAWSLVWIASPAYATGVGEWNSLSSPDFAQCRAMATCPLGGTESDSELAIEFGCTANALLFSTGGKSGGGGLLCQALTESTLGWEMLGSVLRGFGDYGIISDLYVSGSRSGDTFTLTARNEDPTPDDNFFVPSSVGLFRFDGDPQIFDGVEVAGVYDLVLLGLIENDDILFSARLTHPGIELVEEIDVTGIPDEELVLFGAQYGLIPVPAMGIEGAMLMATLLAALGLFFLRLRGRRGEE